MERQEIQEGIGFYIDKLTIISTVGKFKCIQVLLYITFYFTFLETGFSQV